MYAHRNRVLIMDCHAEILMLFERLLEDEGYDTTTVWTGKDGLRALQQERFDLVLVNEYLPDMNAEAFIAELRDRGCNVPCVVMQPSATEITDIRHFAAVGAVAVVCKWSHHKVLEVVGLHTKSTSARMQRDVAFG